MAGIKEAPSAVKNRLEDSEIETKGLNKEQFRQAMQKLTNGLVERGLYDHLYKDKVGRQFGGEVVFRATPDLLVGCYWNRSTDQIILAQTNPLESDKIDVVGVPRESVLAMHHALQSSFPRNIDGMPTTI